MKKVLKKKFKSSANAIHYFGSESLITPITKTVIDGTCYMVIDVTRSACSCR